MRRCTACLRVEGFEALFAPHPVGRDTRPTPPPQPARGSTSPSPTPTPAPTPPRSAHRKPSYNIATFGQGSGGGSIRELLTASGPTHGGAPRDTTPLETWKFEEKQSSRGDAATVTKLKETCLLDGKADPAAVARSLGAEGWEVGKFTLAHVLEVLRKQGRYTEAATLADRMVKAKLHIGTYAHSTIPTVYARAGQHRKLFRYFRRDAPKPPTLQFLNELALILVERGDSCLGLIAAMQKYGITPDDIFFGTVLSRLPSAAGRAEVRAAMAAAGVTPCAAVSRRQLSGASRRSDGEAAEEAMSELLSLAAAKRTRGGGRTPQKGRPEPPCVVTEKDWTMLLMSHVKSGAVEDAKGVLARAERHGVRTAASMHMLHAYLRCHEARLRHVSDAEAPGLVASAEAIFDTARHGEGKEAFNARIFVTTMVSVYAAAGMRDKVGDFLHDAQRDFALSTVRELNYNAVRRMDAAEVGGDLPRNNQRRKKPARQRPKAAKGGPQSRRKQPASNTSSSTASEGRGGGAVGEAQLPPPGAGQQGGAAGVSVPAGGGADQQGVGVAGGQGAAAVRTVAEKADMALL